jgi:hypothetical protein
MGAILIVGSFLLYPHFKASCRKPIIGRVQMTDEDASIVLASLLKNVYRAFDFREESDVYDKLAVSVSGELLNEIYLQNRKSFAVQKAGGAQAKVKEIEVLDVEVGAAGPQPATLSMRSKWTAFGTVGHWGHIHGRKNQYDALITVGTVNNAWKIIDLELLQEERIDPAAKPPKLESKQG